MESLISCVRGQVQLGPLTGRNIEGYALVYHACADQQHGNVREPVLIRHLLTKQRPSLQHAPEQQTLFRVVHKTSAQRALSQTATVPQPRAG